MATRVYVQDVSSGQVHKRFREKGVRGLYSHECDNADTSGAFTVLTAAEFRLTDPARRCRRCFPARVEAAR